MSILAATDLSEDSRTAIRTAARLAEARETSLTVAHFLEATETTPWDLQSDLSEAREQEARDEAGERLEEFLDETFAETARPSNLDVHVDLAEPDEALPTLGDEREAELIVVGSTGRNRVAEFLLGSTAEEVVRSSRCPVLVVRPDRATEQSFERIVAPVDFSDCSRQGLARAITMARSEGAALDILHAYRLPTSDVTDFGPTVTPRQVDELQYERQRQLDEFVEEFDLTGLSVSTHLDVADPATAVVETVEDHDADLVVMGTHGRRGFRKLFLGSTASKVLRRMPCSVMTVRTEDSK
jgi:nucleotide-binding universal stress UspA family protein